MDDETFLAPFYTDQQITILRVVPRVSGAISFLCSALIVGTILIPGDRRGRLTHLYQRLLLALSSADLIFSFNYILGWHLLGSDAGCRMNGFLKAFGVSTAIYNACLCLHFFLMIGFQWTPRKFRESRFEIIFHILAIAWPLVLNTAGASMGLFGGGEGTIPTECVYDAFVLGLFAWFIPEFLSTLLVMATMAGILWCVCRQERKSAKYKFQPAEQNIQTTTTITTITTPTPTTTPTSTRSRLRRESNYRRTREAAKQAAMFITAHLLTFGPKLAISVVIYMFPEQKYYGSVPLFATAFVYLLFVPLQGFWNFCSKFRHAVLFVLLQSSLICFPIISTITLLSHCTHHWQFMSGRGIAIYGGGTRAIPFIVFFIRLSFPGRIQEIMMHIPKTREKIESARRTKSATVC